MTRIIAIVALSAVLAPGAFGQRSGFGGGRGFGGGGHGFAGGRNFRFRPFQFNRFGYSSVGFLGPSYYPFFSNYGYLGDDYSDYDQPAPYTYSAQPNVTVVYLPPAPYTAGPQYIGQRYQPESASPSIQEYSSESAPAPAEAPKQIFFSFALRDGTSRHALAYWVQNQTLHYIDMDGERGELALNEVNRPRSVELNRNRGVDFWLPPVK